MGDPGLTHFDKPLTRTRPGFNIMGGPRPITPEPVTDLRVGYTGNPGLPIPMSHLNYV